ncbi:glycoside hydrolase family 19 protein [Undibacterium terreum]|uniref:Chitinase n=1 Tax=Undibacterium terreum TaxID=1224302 RepID=A0A916V0U3_9BURK|nr:glycoside hydrolase family 19 protein [Undibacterium terreum]GGD00164.1 hypothetical protein GCM10011396_54600 [Undibacterium terreum]
MNQQQLIAIMPLAGTRAALFLPTLVSAMAEFDIKSSARQAAFLAQIAHESGELARVEENLNYRAAGLCKTWPKRFPTLADAVPYEHQPEKIANKVYADRNGNGNEASGDGWRYRGAGLIQLTFKNNQAACAAYFGKPVDQIGDWLRTPEGACRSAGWFWKINNINTWADKGDFDGVCDAVNTGHKTEAIGDAIGYPERLAFWNVAKKVLA